MSNVNVCSGHYVEKDGVLVCTMCGHMKPLVPGTEQPKEKK